MSRIEDLWQGAGGIAPQRLEEMAQHEAWDTDTQQRVKNLALGRIKALQSAQRECTAVKAETESPAEAASRTRAQPERTVSQTGRGKRPRLRRWAVALAACALLLSVGGTAVATLSTDSRLLAALHADSGSQIARLDEMRTPIEQSARADGYKVTVQEAISDRHSVWVLLELEGPEGVTLDENTVLFKNTRVKMEHEGSYGYSLYTLPDDDPADNRLSLLLDISARDQLAGQRLALQLGVLISNLLDEDLQITGELLLAQGPWEFQFTVPRQDSTVTMWQWKRLQHQGVSFLLQKIEVSPLSITLRETKLRVDGYVQLRQEPLQVCFRDGTQLTLTSSSSGSGGSGMSFQYDFPYPVELADITEIRYCGEPLNW